MNIQSVSLMIAFSLFLGGIGLPIPENPVLLGAGYAVFKGMGRPGLSLCLWYSAILLGDLLLFATAYWFFTRPGISRILKRRVGEERMKEYQAAISYWGGWMLFLARFTWGIRAVAYVAAGAAHYPWLRFIVVDGLSVAVQVILFVGIGYYAGEQVEWARASGERIALVLGVLSLIIILVTWLSSAYTKKLSRVALDKAKEAPGLKTTNKGSEPRAEAESLKLKAERKRGKRL